MNKKLITHFVFLLFLSIIYVICRYIYIKSLSDLDEVILYYAILSMIVFCMNFIRSRKVKWILFLIVFFFSGTYFIFVGVNYPDYSSLDLLVIGAQVNAPFLTESIIPFINNASQPISLYVIYFLLPLIYFYGIYYLSKTLINRKWKKHFE